MYCVPFSRDLDPVQVGAKAANLGKALALDVRVPPAFVVTRRALAFFLDRTGLADRVRAYLELASSCDRVTRRQAFGELRSAVLAVPIPGLLKEEVTSRAKELFRSAPAGLAVRSSGVYEDSEKASFAGVYESYLSIPSLEEMWASIRRCWCTCWSPRAIEYGEKMDIHAEPDGIGVIVQQTVPADCAGVVFTADPLTGNPWHFVLNAALGLAQGVVEGSAPADRFVLEWDTGTVLERQVVAKVKAVVPGRSGVREIDLPEGKRDAAALSDETARRIGRMALELDRAFDRRIDVEWAMDGSDLYLIQVRPITALPAFFPHLLDGADADRTWMPSDFAWYTSVREGEHLVAPLFRDVWALELWERYLPWGFFPRRVGQERDFNGYRYQTEWTWKTWGHDFESTVAWLDEHEAELRKAWLEVKEETFRACSRIAEEQRSARWAKDLIPVLLACRELDIDRLATVWAAPQWMIFTCEYLLREFLKEVAPDFPVEKLLQGLPCYSYERTRAAQELGRSIHEEEVREAFATNSLDQLIPYLLANHPGCRFLEDLEDLCWRVSTGSPAWPRQWWTPQGGEGTTQILLTIRNSALGRAKDVVVALEECARDRLAHEQELRSHIRQHDPALLGRFDKILDWAQFWVPVLDDRKWLGVVHMHLAHLMGRTGAALVAEGLLDDSADLLLLTARDLASIAEADDVCRYRELYLARKREYERNRRLAPPEFLGKAPLPPQMESALDRGTRAGEVWGAIGGRVFTGDGLSPGRVTGTVRKTRDVNDPAFLDTLDDEHVLVCPCFTSCGTDWLSLLVLARGLVTIQGHQLAHAVQIARECGVPYVNLVTDDWEDIPDGVRIALDGAEGTVTVLDAG